MRTGDAAIRLADGVADERCGCARSRDAGTFFTDAPTRQRIGCTGTACGSILVAHGVGDEPYGCTRRGDRWILFTNALAQARSWCTGTACRLILVAGGARDERHRGMGASNVGVRIANALIDGRYGCFHTGDPAKPSQRTSRSGPSGSANRWVRMAKATRVLRPAGCGPSRPGCASPHGLAGRCTPSMLCV